MNAIYILPVRMTPPSKGSPPSLALLAAANEKCVQELSRLLYIARSDGQKEREVLCEAASICILGTLHTEAVWW